MRRYRKRKFRRGGGGFFSKAGYVLKTAKSALRTAKFVKNLINVEYKHHTANGAAACAASGTGNVFYLTDIDEGDTSSTRNGDSVRAKSLNLKIHMTSGSAAGGTTCRVLLVKDKANRGANPAITDILTSVSPLVYRNLDTTDRFKVLLDRRHVIGTTGSLDGQDVWEFNFNKKVKHHVKWTGTGGGVADANLNAYFLIIVHGSANVPNYNYNWRFRYVDN